MSQLSEVEGVKYVRSRNPNDRFWCGPTVIAAITGITYAQATFALSEYRGEKFRSSVQVHEIIGVLKKRGLNVEHRFVRESVTVAGFIKRLPQECVGKKVVVVVSGHVLAVEGETVCDTMTQGKPVHISALRKGARARVESFVVVQ
jgi:hypothetical protein